jgi:hypothetical protein
MMRVPHVGSVFVGAQHAAPLTPPLKQTETLPDTIEFA